MFARSAKPGSRTSLAIAEAYPPAYQALRSCEAITASQLARKARDRNGLPTPQGRQGCCDLFAERARVHRTVSGDPRWGADPALQERDHRRAGAHAASVGRGRRKVGNAAQAEVTTDRKSVV